VAERNGFAPAASPVVPANVILSEKNTEPVPWCTTPERGATGEGQGGRAAGHGPLASPVHAAGGVGSVPLWVPRTSSTAKSLRSLHEWTSFPTHVEPYPRIALRRACLLQGAPRAGVEILALRHQLGVLNRFYQRRWQTARWLRRSARRKSAIWCNGRGPSATSWRRSTARAQG
jgi:hypothetical protein